MEDDRDDYEGEIVVEIIFTLEFSQVCVVMRIVIRKWRKCETFVCARRYFHV